MKRLANAPLKPGKAGRRPALKQSSEVPATRVQSYLRSRFDPIRNLTPNLLSTYLDRFKIGYLREIALVWDSIEDRDDKIRLVKSLREKSVARFGYHIALNENLAPADEARAEEHKAALEYFYGNCTTTCAIDENDVGRIKKLVRQMMDAVGKKYAVHEIVWEPTSDGKLTAQFRFTPLWWFENTTGKLRYLATEGETFGTPLEEGGWLVTVGEGLMFATAVAYIFKTLPLRDWVTFSERNGMPAFIGKTGAQINTPQWNAIIEAVKALATDFAAVMNTNESIEILDLKGAQANLPYEPLVKRMDAAIAALWRGGDLSTMSSGKGAEGHGSDRQADEGEILLEDDVEMINETLQMNVDTRVIQYLFGDETPLARFEILLPPAEATAQDIAIDTYLVESGVKLGVNDALKRYGRVAAQEGEEMLQPLPKPPAPPAGLPNRRLANAAPSTDVMDQLLRAAHRPLSQAQAQALAPVRARLEQALRAPDAQLKARIQTLVAELPHLLKQLNLQPATARLLENVYTAALLDGLAAAPTPPQK